MQEILKSNLGRNLEGKIGQMSHLPRAAALAGLAATELRLPEPTRWATGPGANAGANAVCSGGVRSWPARSPAKLRGRENSASPESLSGREPARFPPSSRPSSGAPPLSRQHEARPPGQNVPEMTISRPLASRARPARLAGGDAWTRPVPGCGRRDGSKGNGRMAPRSVREKRRGEGGSLGP